MGQGGGSEGAVKGKSEWEGNGRLVKSQSRHTLHHNIPLGRRTPYLCVRYPRPSGQLGVEGLQVRMQAAL